MLEGNPLDDIKNTREIANVEPRGTRLDREALVAKWKKADPTQ